MSAEQFFFNGIDGKTGEYLLPPLAPEQVYRIAQSEEFEPTHLRELQSKNLHVRGLEPEFAPIEGVDRKNLAETGWGVIFAYGADPEIREAALGQIPCDVLAVGNGAIGLPTLDQLCEHLTDREKQYTLLHFVCHGKLLEQGESVLYWAQDNNQVDVVTETRLLNRLRQLRGARGLPHFAFLSTCESASPEAAVGLGGLGQRLVRDLGMPAVVAMTDKVTIRTAQALAESFYRQLRESGAVDLALVEATAGLAERQDITVPALFSRLGGPWLLVVLTTPSNFGMWRQVN